MPKISELPPDSVVTGSEKVPAVSGSTTVYFLLSALLAGGGGGYATLADFAAANVPSSTVVALLSGYYAAGDGGEAMYLKVGSEPTHELKVQTADGAWWEIAGPDVTAVACGAVGDGNFSTGTGTNDTTAFQNGVDYLNGKGLGGTLWVNPGTFLVQGLAIKGQRMIGLAKRDNVRLRTPIGGTGAIVTDTTGNKCYIENINFRGNYTTNATEGVVLTAPTNAIIKNCGGYQFSGSAFRIAGGLVCLLQYLWGDNNVLGTPNRSSLSQRQGAIDVSGSDHVIEACEISTSLANPAVPDPNDPNDYAWCFRIGAGSTCQLESNIAEYSQNGICIEGNTNQGFRLINNRADQNAHYGYIIQGGDHCIVGNSSYRNNLANASLPAFRIEAYRCAIVGNVGTYLDSDSAPYSYMFDEYTTYQGKSADNLNQYAGNYSRAGCRANQSDIIGGFADRTGMIDIVDADFSFFKTPTPLVKGLCFLDVKETGSKSITDLIRGEPGQKLSIKNSLASAGTLTIVYDVSKIITLSAADIVMAQKDVRTFIRLKTVWQEI